MSYATDTRAQYRLTPNQVDTLNELSGWDSLPVGGPFTNPRTVASLVRRGLVSTLPSGEVALTATGFDVLYAYV